MIPRNIATAEMTIPANNMFAEVADAVSAVEC